MAKRSEWWWPQGAKTTGLTGKGQKQPFSDDRNTLYMDMGAGNIKTHQTVCLRFVLFLFRKSVNYISIEKLNMKNINIHVHTIREVFTDHPT